MRPPLSPQVRAPFCRSAEAFNVASSRLGTEGSVRWTWVLAHCKRTQPLGVVTIGGKCQVACAARCRAWRLRRCCTARTRPAASCQVAALRWSTTAVRWCHRRPCGRRARGDSAALQCGRIASIWCRRGAEPMRRQSLEHVVRVRGRDALGSLRPTTTNRQAHEGPANRY